MCLFKPNRLPPTLLQTCNCSCAFLCMKTRTCIYCDGSCRFVSSRVHMYIHHMYIYIYIYIYTYILAPALACLLFPSRPSVETIYRPAEDTYKHAEAIHKHAEATCKHADAIFAHVKATYTLETACKHASNVCNTT